MISTTWQETDFSLKRLVLAERLPAPYANELRSLAAALGARVTSDNTLPQPGDLWIASYPVQPGEEQSQDVRWVGALEVPIAIYWLRDLVRGLSAQQDDEAAVPLLVG